MPEAFLLAQLDALLGDVYGIDAAEPKRRVVQALCAADDARLSPEQVARGLFSAFRDELWEAHATQDARGFIGVLALARTQYLINGIGDGRACDKLWRLSSDAVIHLMKSSSGSLEISCALLNYALEVGLHLEMQGDVGEHLFSKLFQTCEAAGLDGMECAEAYFNHMAALKLPIKQITMGRLMAVCRAAGDGEAAKRVHLYMSEHGVQFNHYSLTQYLSTFLKLQDDVYLRQILAACEHSSSGLAGKLDRESYARLSDVHTSRACRELLRGHLRSVELISASQPAYPTQSVPLDPWAACQAPPALC